MKRNVIHRRDRATQESLGAFVLYFEGGKGAGFSGLGDWQRLTVERFGPENWHKLPEGRCYGCEGSISAEGGSIVFCDLHRP